MTDAPAFLRYPGIHGDRAVFVCDDDVWTASIDGGAGWRLTAEGAPVASPVISPDGALVAYVSRATGHPEVHVVDVAGGTPRRLSYWGDDTTLLLGWTPEGEVVVATAAGAGFDHDTWAWALPPAGGPGRRLSFGPVSAVAWGGGAVVLGVDDGPTRGAAWKRYRGGRMGKLWIDRDGSGDFERFAADLDGQLGSPHVVDGRVVFVSDHEGWGNVYSLDLAGGDLRRHSDHGDAYARRLDSDGTRLIYQCRGDLWLLDDLGPASQPRRLEIDLRSARTGNRPRRLDPASELAVVAPDDAGAGALLGLRGAVVWLAHRDGPARTLAAGGAVRARLPMVLGADRAVWVSDRGGEDVLEVAPLAGDSPAQMLAAGDLGRVVDLAAAPDGSAVATASHDGWVRITDAATGATRSIDRSAHDIASGLAWSPDSAWLAWSSAGPVTPEDGMRQIRLVAAAGGAVIDATPERFIDHSPAWSTDGRYLAFLSARTYDPVYDQLRFDLDFPAATRPYVLRLTAGTPVPLAATVEGRPAATSPPDATSPAVTVTLDVDGLATRVHPLPVAAGRMEGLIATAGGVAWRSLPLAGEVGDGRPTPDAEPDKARLEHLDLHTGKRVTLVDGADDAVATAGGTRIVVRRDDHLVVVPSDRCVEDGDDDRVEVDLGRVGVEIDPAAEWLQMFDEAGRLMRDRFWVPDMAGVDWAAVLAHYRPLAGRVTTRDELTEVLWETQGELANSHAYAMPPEPHRPPELAQGLLGADLEPDGAGGWLVSHVVPGDPSVPVAASPLEAVGVRAGDRLVAVAGVAVPADLGPEPLLVGTAGRATELTVEREGQVRRVAVTPLRSDRRLRYRALVAARRAEVRRLGGDRVGYIHLPDMQGLGWAEFHRDLRGEVRFAGLVVDFRHNRGGHTSALVLARLAQRPLADQLARDFESFTYPSDAAAGPMVGLTDAQAGSDGDIGPHSFQALGLGPLVGLRSWGGTVGMDGRYPLVDGGMVTQPAYPFFFDDDGWGVENHGVEPDVEVDLTPQDWAAGRDPQLERAVAMVLEAVAAQPGRPRADLATRPDRTPPVLPPRP